jgi:hypothetical protein
MSVLTRLSEGLARNTTRRGLLGRSAQIAFGALAGAAAGAGARGALAGDVNTSCAFPGPPCECDKCLPTGVCAKPCIILTAFYASGCWVSFQGATCCDCDCHDINLVGWCGCGTDYHNNASKCPGGTADT